jgi:hypothetical protein
MNQFKINLNVIVRRGWSVSDEKIKNLIFWSHLDSAENLGPYPDAESPKPSRFHSLMECSHPAFNLQHETNFTFFGEQYEKNVYA